MEVSSQLDAPGYKLYTPIQVAVGAFLGSPLAACWLVAHNYRVQGEGKTANQWIIGGALGAIALLLLTYFLPKNIPITGGHIGYVVALYNTQKMFNGARLAAHEAAGGRRGSWWSVIGWSLLAFTIVATLAIIGAFFLPDNSSPVEGIEQVTSEDWQSPQ